MTFISGESLSSVRAKINDTIVAVAGMLGFSKVVVAGQADIIAPDKNSTLTLVAGTNVTLTTDGGANSVTISSSSGGAGTTNLAYDAATSVVSSDTGTDATLTLVDGVNPGLMSSANFTKLAGVATGATVNATDASLRDRSTHTGTQAVGTITGLGTLATQSGTFSGTSSGTNTGDQTSIVGLSGTKAQFDTAVSDGNIQFVGDAPTAHTHLLAAGATDLTITAANLNTLDDGVDTTLHFHAADRARAVHTGTQLASTISDFSTAADARVVAGITGKQNTLVSGTNIKTVNGSTLLGSGDLVVSGGGATGGTATINFGTAPGTSIASVVVTGQAAIGAGSRIKVWFQGDTTADHNSYEHMLIMPSAVSLVAGDISNGVGFTIYASTELRITGNIACRWEWS